MEVGCDGGNALAARNGQDRASVLHLKKGPAPTPGNALQRMKIG
jgi:hypothetical protein